MKGFTVIELLAVVAVAMVLSLAAWPSFATLLAEHRRITTVNAVVGSLHHARQTAITRAHGVIVCPIGTTGDRCGDDWSRGWAAFKEDAPEALFVHSVSSSAVRVASNRSRFRFRPNGRATNGSVFVCTSAARDARVVVALSGRIRTSHEPTSACRPAASR